MRVGGGTQLIHCKLCGFDHLKCMPCIKRLTAEERHAEFAKYLKDLHDFEERSKNNPGTQIGSRVAS